MEGRKARSWSLLVFDVLVCESSSVSVSTSKHAVGNYGVAGSENEESLRLRVRASAQTFPTYLNNKVTKSKCWREMSGMMAVAYLRSFAVPEF